MDDPVDNDELIKKYNTDPASLDPETAALVHQMDAEIDGWRQAGNIAPPESMERHTFPIGLDNNLQPFPVTPDTQAESHPEGSHDS